MHIAVFSAASDGTTADRQIPNLTFLLIL